MKIEKLLLIIVLVGFGIYLVEIVKEHLDDKIKVEAETNRANCIIETYKVFRDETRGGICQDIGDYKYRTSAQK